MNLVDSLAKGNKSAFSKSVGISNQSLAEILGKRQSAPSFSALQKIFIAFPQVRMEWLVLGVGEMLHESDTKPELSPQELDEAIQNIWSNQFLIRNEIGIELQAPSRIAEMEEEIKWSIRTIKKYEEEIDTLLAEGNSEMEIIRRKSLKSDYEEFVGNIQASLKTEREAMRLSRQEIASWSYRIDGQADTAKPYGGLLSYRLGISTQLARQLLSTGRITGDLANNGEYFVTEDNVRAFIRSVAISYEGAGLFKGKQPLLKHKASSSLS